MKNTLHLHSASARILMRKFKRNLRRKYNHLTKKSLDGLVELYNHMVRRLILVSVWIVTTPALLLIFAVALNASKTSSELASISTPLNVAEPTTQNVMEASVIAAEISDPRPYIVENFLQGTPLAPHSKLMVETADKYGLDYRLIPAIAMKESGGGAAIDLASHNAWGFENGQTYFPSWEYAIDRVGVTLKNGYISKGLTTPEQIMAKYAPPQLETGGKWAKDINLFYSQMETL